VEAAMDLGPVCGRSKFNGWPIKQAWR